MRSKFLPVAAACALQWPRDALEVQVLDDSTDEATRVRVRAFCEQIAAETGVDCRWIHRTDRQGYKAGALEAALVATIEADPVEEREGAPHVGRPAGGRSTRRDCAREAARLYLSLPEECIRRL